MEACCSLVALLARDVRWRGGRVGRSGGREVNSSLVVRRPTGVVLPKELERWIAGTPGQFHCLIFEGWGELEGSAGGYVIGASGVCEEDVRRRATCSEWGRGV